MTYIKTIIFIIILAFASTVTLPCYGASLEDLHFTTEEFTPYNYTENGQITGLSVELLKAIWLTLDIPPQKIDVMPWARAYHNLQRVPDNVLFSMAKIPSREKLFKWACSIDNIEYVLIALKSSNIKISDKTQLKNHRIGTIRYDVAETLLLETIDFKLTIVSNVSVKSNLQLLDKDRIDIIAFGRQAAPEMLKQNGYESSNYEIVYTLGQFPICFAFNKNVDDDLLTKFQQALTKITNGNDYQQLVDKYFTNRMK